MFDLFFLTGHIGLVNLQMLEQFGSYFISASTGNTFVHAFLIHIDLVLIILVVTGPKKKITLDKLFRS